MFKVVPASILKIAKIFYKNDHARRGLRRGLRAVTRVFRVDLVIPDGILARLTQSTGNFDLCLAIKILNACNL